MAQKRPLCYKQLGEEKPGGGGGCHTVDPPLNGTALLAPIPGLLSCLSSPHSFLLCDKALFPGPPFSFPCHIEMKSSLCTRTSAYGCLPTLMVIWGGCGVVFFPFPFDFTRAIPKSPDACSPRLGPAHASSCLHPPRQELRAAALILMLEGSSPLREAAGKGIQEIRAARAPLCIPPGQAAPGPAPEPCDGAHRPLRLYSLKTP